MPSIITTMLTSAVALTSFVTMTTAVSHSAASIFDLVQTLPQCSQTIIFECLSTSKCSPTDFACICAELSKLGVEAKVAAACPTDKDAYVKFAAKVCTPPTYPVSSAVVYPTYPVNSSSIQPYPTPAPPPPPYPSSYPSYNSTVPPPPPAPPVTTTTTVKLTTVVTHIVTTGHGGHPTTITSHIVTPVTSVPSATKPTMPVFTGAGATLNVKNAAVAGAVGIMGYVFAAL